MKLTLHDWQPASRPTVAAPAGDEVQVWLASVPADHPFDCTALARGLSPDEQARLQRGRNPAANQRFLLGRALVRHLLGSWLELPPDRLELAYSRLGKPCLKHPADLRFNLSHSQSLVAMAVTVGCEVGIDIEWLADFEVSAPLVRRVLSPREMQAFDALPATRQRLAWYQTWTRKEACLKAAGVGLTVEMTTFELPAATDKAPRYELCDLTLPPEYTGAVARQRIC